jgi:hypothetical protein
MASTIKDGGPCPFSTIYINLEFPLRQEKARKTSARTAVYLGTTYCAILAVFGGQPQLDCRASVHLFYFSQPSVGTSDFQVVEKKGFPASDDLDSKF